MVEATFYISAFKLKEHAVEDLSLFTWFEVLMGMT